MDILPNDNFSGQDTQSREKLMLALIVKLRERERVIEGAARRGRGEMRGGRRGRKGINL